jgi:hypothetical protein
MLELLKDLFGPMAGILSPYIAGLKIRVDTVARRIIIDFRGKVREFTFEQFNEQFE